jgi:hypothetical protein
MQIFHAFGAIVSGLGGGRTRSLQNQAHRHCGGRGQQISQKRGLVKSTVALAGWVEWHGDDGIELAATQARILQRFAKPASYRIPKVALLCVLELVDEPANHASTAVSRDRAIEMQNAMLAIRATKSLRDSARKRFGAFRTERRNDPGRATLAILAQIFRALDICGTDDTRRWIEKRRQGVDGVRDCESRHNLTTP